MFFESTKNTKQIFQIGNLKFVSLILAGAFLYGVHLYVPPSEFRLFALSAILILPLVDVGLISSQAMSKFEACGLSPIIQRSAQLLTNGLFAFSLEIRWELLVG